MDILSKKQYAMLAVRLLAGASDNIILSLWNSHRKKLPDGQVNRRAHATDH
jgi:hypothetical protein